MNTTDLFVELIITGIGALAWLILLFFSAFGVSSIEVDKLVSVPVLIPLLSLAYVLGIVIDRVSDSLFENLWGKKLFGQFYKNRTDYFDDRTYIYVHAAKLADLMEYGRSRMRICRGSALNAVLLLVSLNLFTWTQIADVALRWRISLFGSLFWIALACGTWFTWYRLTLNNHRRAKEQAEFLRALKADESK